MHKPKHILVIRLSAMGDVAMLLPVLRAFSEAYPELKITLLTRPFFAPIFQSIPQIDIFEAEVKGKHKGVFGLKKLSEELLDLGIDAVADMHNVLRSNMLKLFFKLKGIPVIQLNKGRNEKKALTRSKNKIFVPLKHSTRRYAEVFEQLGFPVNLDSVALLPPQMLSPSVLEISGKKQQKWLGIAPFAQHRSKEYPEDLMKQVLLELQKWQNLKVFLFGGGKVETGKLAALENEFSNAISVAGKLSFEDELVLISNLDAMLSMDSGNGHLAANYGIPVITLWGLTHPFAGFAPFKQPPHHSLLPDLQKFPAIPTSVYGKDIPKGYEAAMRSIKPQEVVEKVESVLDL